MRQLAGYTITSIGAIILLLSYSSVQKALAINLPTQLSDTIITVIGIAFVVLGAFLLFQGSSGKVAEVPIYHGKQIVGYRRVKN